MNLNACYLITLSAFVLLIVFLNNYTGNSVENFYNQNVIFWKPSEIMRSLTKNKIDAINNNPRGVLARETCSWLKRTKMTMARPREPEEEQNARKIIEGLLSKCI
jgi:hypothetical protein